MADGLGELDGVSINQICFFLLLFADDMVLFSKDPMELQSLLDKLYAYSTKWGLKLNLVLIVLVLVVAISKVTTLKRQLIGHYILPSYMM